MKRCSKCSVEKELTNFYKIKNSNRVNAWCKLCGVVYNRDRLSKCKDKTNARQREKMEQKQAWLSALKVGPCSDCKKTFDSVCMDWDHVSGKKVGDVSRLLRSGRSKETILTEIAKCELVCANCHRIRTHEKRHAHKGVQAMGGKYKSEYSNYNPEF